MKQNFALIIGVDSDSYEVGQELVNELLLGQYGYLG